MRVKRSWIWKATISQLSIRRFQLARFFASLINTQVDTCHACQDMFEVLWKNDNDAWNTKEALNRDEVVCEDSSHENKIKKTFLETVQNVYCILHIKIV